MEEGLGLIKVKPQDEEKIIALLSPNERVMIGFPYGKKVFDNRWHQFNQPEVFDHIVVTNTRVILLKKEWFLGEEGQGWDFPFQVVTSVALREQTLGCTLSMRIETESGNFEYNLENCSKKEGEAACEFLKKMMGKVLCPFCFKPISLDFLFCPACEKKLKNTCPECGKTLEQEWTICPYCGKK